MMYDITFCVNNECPHKDKCFRHTGNEEAMKAMNGWVSISYFDINDDGNCEDMIRINYERTKNNKGST